MGDIRYLYSVHPKRIIKNLSDTIPVIRTNKTLSLTLDEVLVCVRSAVVYRRFANEGRNERVTIANAERLHNSKFMTEEEYKEFLKKENKDTVQIHKDVKKEEVKEEVVKTENTSEPVVNAEQKNEDPVIDEKEIAVESGVTGTVTDYSNTVIPNNQNNKKDYGGKNKHHH